MALAPLHLRGEPLPVNATPLYWLWNSSIHDSAYVTSSSRLAELQKDRNYRLMGMVGRLLASAQTDTRELACFYKGAPQTDTFCTASAFETSLVREWDYAFVSREGFVATRKLPGMRPMFRLSKSFGKGDDREHRFTIFDSEVAQLRKEGWILDGTKGYIYPP